MFSSQPITSLKDEAPQFGQGRGLPGGSSMLATSAVSLEPFAGVNVFLEEEFSD